MMTKKKFFLIALICFVCYVPYLVFFFPGVCNWDTVGQISDYFGGDSPIPIGWMEGQDEITPFLSDHHPVFDTVVFSLFIKFGIAIFNSANIGFFAYVLVQTIVFSITFAFVIYVLKRLGLGKKYIIAVGVFYTLFLPIPFFVIDMLKDSLFTLCFIWYFMIYILVILEKPTKKKIVALTLIGVLLGLTKKTGVYILLLSALAIMPKIWHNFRLLSVFYVLACPLVMFVLMAKIIFPIFNIEPGGKQELLAIPIQQISRVAVEKDFDSEEREIIGKIISYDQIKDLYRSDLVDPIKGTFNHDASQNEILDFLKLWIATGFKEPELYLRAMYGLVGGFFIPNTTININTKIPEPWRGSPEIKQLDAFTIERQNIVDFYYGVANSPLLGILFKIAIYTFIIPISAGIYLAIRRDWQLLWGMIPVLLVIATLFLCPTTDSRYGLPLIMTTPIVVGLGLKSYRNWASAKKRIA